MAREICSEEKSRSNMVSSTGFCYSDVSSSSNPTIQTHLVSQIQGFESNPAEIFNLTTGMEMIGFSKNLQHQQSDTTNSVMWKGFFGNKPENNNSNPSPGGAGPSSSKTINESAAEFYQQEFNKQPDFTTGISETSSENQIIVGPHSSAAAEAVPWQEHRLFLDESSMRCVFPCEGNERPSQGLSLSLSSTNPSGIGLQSFELRHTTNHQNHENPQGEMRFMNSSPSSRDGFFGKSAANIQLHQQQQFIQDGFLTKDSNLHHDHHHHQGQFQLRSSRYLGPAQELLHEFCSLGTKLNAAPSPKPQKPKQWEDENNGSSSGGGDSSRKQSLHSLEFMELQKRKTKLLAMLEELDRRYKHYRDQMKAVVASFEAVAGNGAATVYSALASKAMSRHFRCLRDGIVSQIHATKKAMGEKDPVAPGTTRGETPRLRILDQALRHQKAFQQMTMMESHPWRPQRGLPERSVSVLRAWLFEHFLHPYPSDVDKHILARQTGLSRSQVSNWFINARVRLWKPMVEEMYMEELKEQDNNMASSDGISTDLDHQDNNGSIIGRLPNSRHLPSSTDQKPTPDQLVRIDSECLSSIISNPDKNNNDTSKLMTKTFHQNQNFGAFGAMEVDFSAYNHHHDAAGGGVSYANDQSSNQNFNGGGGVSLTLGLQQHGGNGGGGGGVSLAFPPASQSSLFYSRDHIEDCQPVQYSLLDGETQNLPYRNLMGAQLLHDLAG